MNEYLIHQRTRALKIRLSAVVCFMQSIAMASRMVLQFLAQSTLISDTQVLSLVKRQSVRLQSMALCSITGWCHSNALLRPSVPRQSDNI